MENSNFDPALDEIKKYNLPERIIVGKFEPTHGSKFDSMCYRIPEICRIVHVAEQAKDGKMCIWAEIDPVGEDMQTFVDVKIVTIGTGMSVPEDGEWLKTYQDGPFVWHLYLTR